MTIPVIAQEAYILDGRTIPQFWEAQKIFDMLENFQFLPNIKDPPQDGGLNGLRRFVAKAEARDSPIAFASGASLRRNTIDFSQIRSVLDGQNRGMALYPRALTYLDGLGIVRVEDLYDARCGENNLATSLTIDALATVLTSLGNIIPVFDAIVKPSTSIGTNRVRVCMSYEDLGILGNNVWDELANQSLDPRNILIGAVYSSQETAGQGLQGLSTLFPEMYMRQLLLGFTLPGDVNEAYESAFNYADDVLLEDDDIGCLKEALKNEGYIALHNKAVALHLRSLNPHLDRMGVKVHAAGWVSEDSRSRFYQDVGDLDELADDVADASFSVPIDPSIVGTHKGSEVYIFLSPAYDFQDVGSYSMGIIGANETLVDLLGRMRSIPNP